LERGDPPQFASLASPACQTSVQIQLQMTDSVSNCVVSASPFADVFHIVEKANPKKFENLLAVDRSDNKNGKQRNSYAWYFNWN